MNKIKYIKNGYGTLVKKCCASCAYKDLTRARSVRRCTLHSVDVNSGDVCRYWKMSRQLRAVGRSQGCIKSKEYLDFYRDVRSDEEAASVETHMTEEIRELFKQNYGCSPYIII